MERDEKFCTMMLAGGLSWKVLGGLPCCFELLSFFALHRRDRVNQDQYHNPLYIHFHSKSKAHDAYHTISTFNTGTHFISILYQSSINPQHFISYHHQAFTAGDAKPYQLQSVATCN